jgi:hypothetical protein
MINSNDDVKISNTIVVVSFLFNSVGDVRRRASARELCVVVGLTTVEPEPSGPPFQLHDHGNAVGLCLCREERGSGVESFSECKRLASRRELLWIVVVVVVVVGLMVEFEPTRPQNS